MKSLVFRDMMSLHKSDNPTGYSKH